MVYPTKWMLRVHWKWAEWMDLHNELQDLWLFIVTVFGEQD